MEKKEGISSIYENLDFLKEELKRGGNERIKEQIRQIYMEKLGLPDGPQVIFILGGGVSERKTKRSERLEPTAYSEEAESPQERARERKRLAGDREIVEKIFGAGGAKGRLIAGAELNSIFSSPICVGGKFFLKTESQEIEIEYSQVYKDYLQRLEVKKEDILSEEGIEEAINTFEELIRAIKLSLEKNFQLVAIITNDYHVPRAQLMFEYLKDKSKAQEKLKYLLAKLPEHYQKYLGYRVEIKNGEAEIFFEKEDFFENLKKLKFVFISAEDVLQLRHPLYRTLVAKIKENENYQRRVEQEKKGLQALENGTYGKKS